MLCFYPQYNKKIMSLLSTTPTMFGFASIKAMKNSTNVTCRAKRDQLGELLIFQESEKMKKNSGFLEFSIFLYC